MKKTFLTLSLLLLGMASFAQTHLISYEDLKFMLRNVISTDDTFLVSKGYHLKKNNPKNKSYELNLAGGIHNNIEMRSDGKKIFIEIQTNAIEQYDMIRQSIASFKVNSQAGPDTEAYQVKNLGNIYMIISDSTPYDPLKRDYDIQVVPDKNITAVE